ncbi:hypothetical protein LOK49_LG07G01784 [Camellia lanceoleosa]|uniref:Uncharacterized protein n=1 Tax=Camellia lanceoleosa TaxID=1840588 RepID=A0ACC0H9F4_9ERIC|nr:hypothetical protein LOK49_LG07G01784 [Camellia lanceoleosa]
MAPKAFHLRHPNLPPHLFLHLQHQGPPNGLEYDEKFFPSIGNEVLKAVVIQFNADQLLTEHPNVSALVRENLVRYAKDFNIVFDDVAIMHLLYGAEFSKLRNSLIHEGRETCESFCDPNEDNDYDNGGFDFGPSDFDMPENAYEYEEVPLQPEMHNDGGVCFETNEHEDPSSQASLEDLCQSHLDALHASIAETEKQTELAARVSTWKQRIENNLEDQASAIIFTLFFPPHTFKT